MKASKRMKEVRAKVDPKKIYTLDEAVKLVKETSTLKFDPTVELHANLGIDPKKGDQLVRGSVVLPHGSGKKFRVAAFVPENKAKEAKAAGADIVGGEELIEEIKKTNKCDFDVAVTTPDMMKSLAAVARILGQKGLMPNPKTGTIGPDVAKMVEELKKGKVSFKNDANASLHLAVGKASLDEKQLKENLETFLDALKKSKPPTLKKTFIRQLFLSSTMGPSIKVKAN